MSWESEGVAMIVDAQARHDALAKIASEVRTYVFVLCAGPDGVARTEAIMLAASFQMELMRSRGILPSNT